MASRKSKSLIYNLCCSQKSLQKAFEAAERLNMSDDDLIYWFGQPPYRFAGSATYKQAQVQEEKIICSPYNEFGTYSKSLKWRQNLWRNKLPQEMRDVIPFEEVGPWRDVDSGIEFKFEEEDIWSFRIPITLSRGGKKEALIPMAGKYYTLQRGNDLFTMYTRFVFCADASGCVEATKTA